MILDPVDKRLRVLYTDTKCESFTLKFPTLAVEQLINITGRMPCRQNDFAGRKDPGSVCNDVERPVVLLDDICHPGIKMIFTSVLNNAFPDIFHDSRKFIASDMRMCINQY